ncbi:release factor [Trametes polyzona]|nr:release factor [Trametes polyzona]
MEANLEVIQSYLPSDKLLEKTQRAQAALEDPQLWIANPAGATQVESQLAEMQHQLRTRERLSSSLNRLKEMSTLAVRIQDPDLQKTALVELQGLLHSTEEHLVSLWLSDPVDQYSAFITVAPIPEQAGLPNSWTSTLVRMYTEWAQSRKYAVKVMEDAFKVTSDTKAVTLLVEGRAAYGYAQYESGIHRLDRISPSDDATERHTSSSVVRVSPYIEEDDSNAIIDLRKDDLRITTTRGDCAGQEGGDDSRSIVRIVHTPTGVAVSCQQGSSQHQNRSLALSLLRAKLYDMELEKKAQSAADTAYTLPASWWSAPIRSYTLGPHQTVKDLRTGYEVTSDAVQDVLDGNLGGFMEASLRKFKKKAA